MVLLELYFDELNANVKRHIVRKYEVVLRRFFRQQLISDGLDVNIFSTPQRIILQLNFGENITYLEKGVKLDASADNLSHFLAKMQLKSKDDLEVVEGYYCHKNVVKSSELENNFLNNIDNILKDIFLSINFKSNSLNKTLLALKNILCLTEAGTHTVVFNNIKSSNYTIINGEYFKVDNYQDFFSVLSSKGVYLDALERKDKISKELESLGEINPKFLDNICCIREKPRFLLNKIEFCENELFLNILQKYLRDEYQFFLKDGELYFLYLEDNGIDVTQSTTLEELYSRSQSKGQKKSLTRSLQKLHDLIHKYELNTRRNSSKNHRIIFNSDKPSRLSRLTKFIALWVPYANIANVEEVLTLCNHYNLLERNTELELMIKEFILLKNHKNAELVNTIIDSCRPLDKSSQLPQIPLAIAIALARRLDEAVFLSVNREIKNVMGQRDENRIYDEIIKILLEYNLNLPLKMVLHYSFRNFIRNIIRIRKNKKITREYLLNDAVVIENILTTFYERFYHFMSSNGADVKLLNVVFLEEIKSITSRKNKCNLTRIHKKINGLNLYFKRDDSRLLLTTYKRLHNLLIPYAKTEKIPLIKLQKLNKTKEGSELYFSCTTASRNIRKNIRDNDYYEALVNLQSLVAPLNNFLNNVYIKQSGYFAKKRIIRLLLQIKHLFSTVINFNGMI